MKSNALSFAIFGALLFFNFSSQAGRSVIFNEPGFLGNSTTTIEDHLVGLIQQTPAGASIHGAMYTFNRPAVALALADAAARGVDVHMVLDGKNKKQKDNPTSAAGILNQSLGDNATFCKHGSCRGLHIMHNKFFLFSKLMDGRVDVVAQTSSNLSDNQMSWYNDLLIWDGDARLYKNFRGYWKDLKKQKTETVDADVLESDSGSIKAYTFPRLFKEDPVLKALDKVSCQIPGSVIRVAHSRFDNFRDKVAKKLRNLAREGCDVQVIGRDEPSMKSPGSKVKSLLGSLITVLPFKGKHIVKGVQTPVKNSFHTKLILVKSSIDQSRELQTMILTGSHNLNISSVSMNDEILMVIRNDSDLFDSYLGFWNRLWTESKILMEESN